MAGMRGFTIIELLLVTSFVALLLALGLPALHTLQGNLATAAESQRLLSLLRLARAGATARQGRTVLCPLHTGGTTPACGAPFNDGWLLFLDANGDGAYASGDDELLRMERVPRRRALRVLDARGRGFAGAVTYRPDGSVLRPATLRLCAEGAQRRRRVVISMTGRVRTAREASPCAV